MHGCLNVFICLVAFVSDLFTITKTTALVHTHAHTYAYRFANENLCTPQNPHQLKL